MKIKICLTAVIGILAIAGCQTGDGGSRGDAGSSSAQSDTSKNEYLAGVRDKMKTMDDKIADLSAKSKDLGSDARKQADAALAELKRERAILAKKYDEMSAATQDAWSSAKESFGTAWDQMQSSMAAALSKFN